MRLIATRDSRFREQSVILRKQSSSFYLFYNCIIAGVKINEALARNRTELAERVDAIGCRGGRWGKLRFLPGPRRLHEGVPQIHGRGSGCPRTLRNIRERYALREEIDCRRSIDLRQRYKGILGSQPVDFGVSIPNVDDLATFSAANGPPIHVMLLRALNVLLKLTYRAYTRVCMPVLYVCMRMCVCAVFVCARGLSSKMCDDDDDDDMNETATFASCVCL